MGPPPVDLSVQVLSLLDDFEEFFWHLFVPAWRIQSDNSPLNRLAAVLDLFLHSLFD